MTPATTRVARPPRALITQALTNALFASMAQPSEDLDDDNVRTMIRRTIRQHGCRGCQVAVAFEFGRRPDVAASRMSWAITVVRNVYFPGYAR